MTGRGGRWPPAPLPFRAVGGTLTACRVTDSLVGGLWKTHQSLWTTLDSGLGACGQRSTEREVTVTIGDHEPHRTAPSHAAARLSRLWRDRHTLQLGVGPGPAVLLELANPRAAHLLDLLDGTRSERSVLAHAATVRVTADEARTLLDALRTAGLLVPAHSLLPRDLAGPVRARLAAEAGALALAAARLPGTPAQVLRRRRTTRSCSPAPGRSAGL